MTSTDSDKYIKVEGLTRHFRRAKALDGLDMEVGKGEIFALLGPNGAGKTTTLGILLGLVAPSAGRAAVLGTDVHRLGPRELASIGYVSEEQELPVWSTLDRLIGSLRRLYPTWDDTFCDSLIERFELDRRRRVRSLSRGMRIKVRMVLALAYRPRLLLMDEPFSGLDPMVRQDVIDGILELTEQESWTVLLASHDMATVGRLADRVGFLSHGRMILDEDLEQLHRRCRRTRIDLSSTLPPGFAWPSTWLEPRTDGGVVEFLDAAWDPQAEQRYRDQIPGITHVDISQPTLEQIFIAVHRGPHRQAHP